MSFFLLSLVIIIISGVSALFVYKIWQKKYYIWLGGYIRWLKDYKSRRIPDDKLVHIMFLIVDHFEPGTKGADKNISDKRFNEWITKYPMLAKKHKDSSGKHPQHVFFFPPHYFTSEYMSKLSELAFLGYGEVEFHLHHDNDTSESLRQTIIQTLELYSRFGALVTAEKKPRKAYGFIHGDWALDNSRGGKYCGVNDELLVLKNTGCYADFTMPSLHESQARKINSIYYAIDDPEKPKSYDEGIDVTVGKAPAGDLMLIEGPLFVNWRNFKRRLYPSVEDAEISRENPPTKKRIDKWIKCGISVKGRPEWIFIKLHCHGAPEKNHAPLLGEPSEEMFSYLEEKYNDGKRYKLHYVSAREAYNIIKAAEAGEKGDPDDYRNYIIPQYANQLIKTNTQYTLNRWTDEGLEILDIENKGESIFEFKDKTIKKVKAPLKYIDFVQSTKARKASLKIRGSGKGEALFATPSEIKPINNAEILDQKTTGDNVITSIGFYLHGGETKISVNWGNDEG